jgi:hypothetical protein
MNVQRGSQDTLMLARRKGAIAVIAMRTRAFDQNALAPISEFFLDDGMGFTTLPAREQNERCRDLQAHRCVEIRPEIISRRRGDEPPGTALGQNELLISRYACH